MQIQLSVTTKPVLWEVEVYLYTFTLKIDGTEIKPEVIRELELNLSLDALDCLSVRLSLDAGDLSAALPCKVGAPWKLTLGASTYEGDIVRMNYHLGHNSTLTFIGLEKIHRLRGVPFAQVFKDPKHKILSTMSSASSVTISGDAVKATATEFPLVTDSVLATAKKYALERNFALFFDGTQIRFAPRDTTGASITLKWGEDLGTMDMTVDISEVASKVQVYGRDYRKGTDAITFTAQASNLKKLSGGDDAITWRKKASALDMMLEGYLDCTSATAAEDQAVGELQRRAEGFVTGTIITNGVPDAAPTKKVSITNAPWPLKGPFVIQGVSHRFDGRSGHRTIIEFYSDSLPSA